MINIIIVIIILDPG